MNPASATIALLLADARLPAGGFAHSSGLEPALLGGMPPADVPAYLRARVRTTALTDAGVAVVARHVLLPGGGPASGPPRAERGDRPLRDQAFRREQVDLRRAPPVSAGSPDPATGRTSGAGLAAVERAWAARTPSAAMRAAARDLGRGLLRLARRVWPESASIAAVAGLESAAIAAVGARPAPPRPLVLGAIAAAAGIDAETLVRIAVYDDVACAVAALLKLEPGDPAAGVALTLEACAVAEPEIARVAALTTPGRIPAESAPQAEAWAEDHALTDRRLFRA